MESAGIAVTVEVRPRRTFASALDWPGWARSGRTAEAALEALATYAPRYGRVVTAAGLHPPAAGPFVVAERVPGDATTDFGAPGQVTSADGQPLSAAELDRRVALLRAAWAALGVIAAGAPAQLRKGPRGGGRDRDAVVEHVVSAEAAYARKVGVRRAVPRWDDAVAVAALRDELVGALRAATSGEPLVPRGWPARYALRRVAWHVLDHAWEIEDRSTA